MKTTIYDEITHRIITLLEQGVAPWKSPYLATVGFPRNFATGKPYRGINIFLLGSQRYTSPYFLTYVQARELGGFVRKGEHGSLVVKYGTYTKETRASETSDATEEQRGYLKGYTVFNAAQIEGIDFPNSNPLPNWTAQEKCDRAREIVATMPKAPAIKGGVAVPCYRPHSDTVHMPEREYFTGEETYYSTLFHELAHATGHSSRLARKTLLENKGAASGEGKKIYAEEELVAEMAASFLCAPAGIIEAEIENSAAYLQGWIKALKGRDAKTWIVKAASEAQKAADYILNGST